MSKEKDDEYVVFDGGWGSMEEWEEKVNNKERIEQMLKNSESLSDKDKLLAEKYGLLPAKKE